MSLIFEPYVFKGAKTAIMSEVKVEHVKKEKML